MSDACVATTANCVAPTGSRLCRRLAVGEMPIFLTLKHPK